MDALNQQFTEVTTGLTVTKPSDASYSGLKLLYRISDQHVELILYMSALTITGGYFVITGDVVTQIQNKIIALTGIPKECAIWFNSELNNWYIQNEKLICSTISAISNRYQTVHFYI